MQTIRRFQPGDEHTLVPLIHRCLRETNRHDYDDDAIAYWVSVYTPAHVAELAQKAHMFVLVEDDVLLGTCSAVHTAAAEGAIEALYVLPDCQREGLASKLLATAERDLFAAGALTIWIDSSITARTYYEEKGYRHETGTPVCIDNDRFIMYKKRPSESAQ